jgi:hypothetical protein
MSTGDVAKGRKLVARALELNPKFDARGEAEARRIVGAK